MSNSDSSVYSEALTAALIPFRDLAFFTNASEPLSINLGPRSASMIRISINGPGALKLTGVEVHLSDEPTVEHSRPPLDATFRTSERPEELVSLSLSNEQVLPDQPVIEVGRSENPWVILDLGAPCDLARIRLWSSAMPRQAWAPLLVETSEGGENWEVAYSTVTRLSAQADLIASIGAKGALTVEDPYAWRIFTEVVGLLVDGQRRQAEKRLRYSKLPAETLSAIRSAVTSAILEPMQLDWNHHGIRRTFKYWTNREKVKYIKTANHFIGRLAKELSPNVCLGFGSVLSLVRDQDLIPHDDDLDIIIAFDRDECPTVTEGFNRLVEFAARHGYRVREPSPRSHRQFIREGSRKVDVFVGLQDNGRISWYPQKRGDLAMTDVFPPIRASILGVECLIPRNPLRYLESVYGPRWSKPDPFFAHDWRTRDYDDIW